MNAKTSFYLLVLMISLFCASERCSARVKLIMSVDQGFENGIVAKNDILAARRIAKALVPLKQKYDVYALFTPAVPDKDGLIKVMKAFVANDIPIVLDAISSDAFTIGSASSWLQPSDVSHGIACKVSDLRYFRQSLGKYFAGLRFHEVFAEDFTVYHFKRGKTDWGHPSWKTPEDDFFNPSIANEFCKFASENDLFVIWSDFHWQANSPWDERQTERERAFAKVIAEHSCPFYVLYANNEPGETAVGKINDWPQFVKPFLKYGAKGFGLSNQSWMFTHESQAPPDALIEWAIKALRMNAAVVQFEPVWYWFNYPSGVVSCDAGCQGMLDGAGKPRERFNALKDALLSFADKKEDTAIKN